MKPNFNKPFYKIGGFFLFYFLLMSSIIFGVISSNGPKKELDESKSSIQKFEDTFTTELRVYENKIEKRNATKSDRWRPSDRFVIIALTLSSILDIVIVLVWARYENRKREGQTDARAKPSLTDRKWFWNIVAMGIIQPKNNKLVLDWRNLIFVVIAMYLMKKAIVDQL